MTDEKLVLTFLERNYTAYFNDNLIGFRTIENNKIKIIHADKLLKEIYTIFGDFAVKYYTEWISQQKRKLFKEVYDLCDEFYDGNRSRPFLDKVLLSKETLSFKVNSSMVKDIVIGYYNDKYTNKKIEEYKNRFDKHLATSTFFDSIKDDFILEHEDVIKYIKDNIISWYKNEIMGDKIHDFLSQLVITLGRTNWVVTWIGHGPITNEKILKAFKNEDEFFDSYILQKYNEWYEDAVIEASAKAMKFLG